MTVSSCTFIIYIERGKGEVGWEEKRGRRRKEGRERTGETKGRRKLEEKRGREKAWGRGLKEEMGERGVRD